MQNTAPSILLVDDDPDIQLLYTSALSARGFTVRSACDGTSCIASIERDQPDLVILDLGLPAGDGETALRNLRSKDKFDGLPVLIFSARGEADWGDRLRALGATAYLQKPASPDQVLAAVNALLGRPSAPVAPAPAPPQAHRPQAALPQRIGSLSCPHCGQSVAALEARLDPGAVEALARVRANG